MSSPTRATYPDNSPVESQDQDQALQNLCSRIECVHTDVMMLGNRMDQNLTAMSQRLDSTNEIIMEVRNLREESNSIIGTDRIPGRLPPVEEEAKLSRDFRKQAMAVIAVLVLLVGWLISLNYKPDKGLTTLKDKLPTSLSFPAQASPKLEASH